MVQEQTFSIKTIIHVDMDAFYASVEARDNPELKGKPLVIGALPGERGVVATCSYEARTFGVRSAMPISEAYRLCPDAIYMRANFAKYEEASALAHQIWSNYTDIIEYISLDEGFLDVTHTAELFGGASQIAHSIKKQVLQQIQLTCSVGIGYSLMSAKLASEERKPDGYFEILTPDDLVALINDRSVRVIYGVGAQTAAQLQKISVRTVRDVREKQEAIILLLGNHGKQIIALANGIDNREVASQAKALSLGKEHTFQKDVSDVEYLRDVLRLIARELSFSIRDKGIFCCTVTLKATYQGMKKITRSHSGEPMSRADEIYSITMELLDKIEKRPVRLIGITLSNFTDERQQQSSLLDGSSTEQIDRLSAAIMDIQRKHGLNAIKTGSELSAEKHVKQRSKPD